MPPPLDASSQDLWEFERRVLQQLEGHPAIVASAAGNSLPLERGINTPMTIAGRPDLTGTVEWRAVTPGYFETLGIARIAGRSFEPADAAGGPPVAVVNDAFARRYFAGANPIGRQIDVGRFKGALRDSALEGGRVEVIGVGGAMGLSQFVAGFLWGVTTTDPTTLWSVAAILLCVGVAASWIPARTAAKLDPARTLAHD